MAQPHHDVLRQVEAAATVAQGLRLLAPLGESQDADIQFHYSTMLARLMLRASVEEAAELQSLLREHPFNRGPGLEAAALEKRAEALASSDYREALGFYRLLAGLAEREYGREARALEAIGLAARSLAEFRECLALLQELPRHWEVDMARARLGLRLAGLTPDGGEARACLAEQRSSQHLHSPALQQLLAACETLVDRRFPADGRVLPPELVQPPLPGATWTFRFEVGDPHLPRAASVSVVAQDEGQAREEALRLYQERLRREGPPVEAERIRLVSTRRQ